MAQQTEQAAPPGTPVRVDVGFDEIETSLAEQKVAAETQAEAAKAATIEEARVKAAAAAAPPANESVQVRALQEALRISEESRRQVIQQGASAAPVAPPVLRKTKEELAALMQSDPLAAIAYLQEETVRTVTENVERRVGSLLKGSESTAETLARQKYPVEFELFGSEIQQFVATLPEANRASLGTTAGWDDLVSWFRGRPGNFEKMITKRAENDKNAAAATAQAAQAAAVGATVRSDQRAPASTSTGQLDATQKEIAKTLNMSEAQYIQWARVAP